jgi:hypothetical protein
MPQDGLEFPAANLKHPMAEKVPGWVRRWEQSRRGGRTRFIWVQGVCSFGLPICLVQIGLAIEVASRGINLWLAAIPLVVGLLGGYLYGLVVWNVTESAYLAAQQQAQMPVERKGPGFPLWYDAGFAAFCAILSGLNAIMGSWWISAVFGCMAVWALFALMGRALRRQRVTVPREHVRYPDIEDGQPM